MPKLRFAIIGCGRMGRHHAQILIDDGRGEVAALLDANRSMAQGLQQDLSPAARICDSLQQLVSLGDIDAAIICTPTAEHHGQALACLDRGWHLLCEKPLAASRAEILELMARAELANSKRQIFSLGYQRRHTSLYRTIPAGSPFRTLGGCPGDCVAQCRKTGNPPLPELGAMIPVKTPVVS